MKRGAAQLAALAVLAALQSCKAGNEQATEVLLEVDAEPGVRAALASLEIDIRGGAADAAYSAYSGESRPALRAPALPLQVALVPQGGDATRMYQVTLRARDAAGGLVAQARVISGYVKGSLRFARLVLEDDCIGVTQCAGSPVAPLTCRGGACADPRADAHSFSSDPSAPSTIKPPPVTETDPDGGVSDTGGPEPDGGGQAPDAGHPPRDAGSAQGGCKLGSSQLPCRLGM